MGWTDSHVHRFRRGATYYGQPDAEMGMECEDERRVVLRQVLRRPKDRMVYEYDFGDGWEHDVVLEAIGEGEGRSRRSQASQYASTCLHDPRDAGRCHTCLRVAGGRGNERSCV